MPISLLYKVHLKTCPTTCVLVSKDGFISLCCKVIMLFIASQTLHRSPRLFWSSFYKVQCADSTLHLKSQKNYFHLLMCSLKKNEYRLTTFIPVSCSVPRCITLFVHIVTNLCLWGTNHVCLT